MNKIIILIMGIFVMAGLVYALATFTAVGGGLVGHWALDGESYDSNTERITDKTPYENHGTNYGATLTTDQMGQSDRAMSFDVNEESLILNYLIWKDGQTGSVGSFSRNGDTSENYRIIDRDPWGRQVVVWEARPDNVSGADGGWNHNIASIDNTKTYRFSTWVNLKVKGADGRFYLGTNGYGAVNGVIRLSDNTTQTNPYFWHSLGLPEDQWVLVVGHVYPYTHTGTSNHPDSGRYYANGTKLGSISYDYKWLPETTSGRHRSYLYYCTDISVRQHWIYPRVDVVDGTEPAIEELLDGYDSYGDDIVAEVVEDKESFSFWYVNNSNGNWTHVVNSSGTLYVNGELGTPNQYPLYISGNNVYIGRTTASDFFNGSISDVRIYNHALSADEIDTLYQTYRRKASAGSLQKGLVGHWMLDSEGYNSATQRITDKTPYENHGTNDGATLTTDQMEQGNRAMSFDGNDIDYIITASPAVVPENGTISVWIKGQASAQKAENIYPSGFDYVSLLGPSSTSDTRAGLIAGTGGDYDYSNWGGQNTFNGNWHHYLVFWEKVGSSYQVYLYLDGKQIGNPKTSTKLPAGAERYIKIGVAWGTYGAFTGSISDVRIYNRALSANEIDTLYHSYRPKAAAGSLLKGLVLDMPLKFKYTKDETASSEILTDRTPYSNDGQNYGATVGSNGTSFDGVNDYVGVGASTSLGVQSFTSGMWVNPNSGSLTDRHNLYKADTYQMAINNGKFIVWIHDTNAGWPSRTSTTSPVAGNWYYVTASYENSTKNLSIYVNENLESSTILTYPKNPDSSSGMTIGDHSGSYRFNGTISDVRIYNRALSAQEIKLLYDKGR